jgi:hypothetical protein
MHLDVDHVVEGGGGDVGPEMLPLSAGRDQILPLQPPLFETTAKSAAWDV